MTQMIRETSLEAAASLEREVMDLLHRAALLRLPALAFAEPRVNHCQSVLAALDSAAQHDTWPESTEGMQALTAFKAEWEVAAAEDLAREYARLFMRDCPCPPHETAFGDGCRMGGRAAELADISGFYLAFGLNLSDCDPDLPDHLCAEVEFYSMLLLKTAYAVWHGRAEQEAITRKAAADFLSQHLGRWTGAFRERLDEVGCLPVYAASAALLDYLVHEECRHTGTEAQAAAGYAGPAPAEPATCPMACRQPN